MKRRTIEDLLREYKEVKECGSKIYLSYDAIRKLCGINTSGLSEKMKHLIKKGDVEIIEVVLPADKACSGVKRIKAVRLI